MGNYSATLCGKVIGHRGKILKSFPKKSGYLCVSLSEGYGKPNQTLLHRFIWEFFKGPIPPKMTVDHIDGDKTNNKINNLQLLSRGENSRKGNRILKDEDLLELLKDLPLLTGREISKKYNISPQTVSNIRSGFRWKDITGVTEVVRPVFYSSSHKGVSWDKRRNKWLAQIKRNKKHIFIGRFNTEQEALEAYNNEMNN
jgi:hypothetical protein